MRYRRPSINAGTASAFAWNGLIDHAEHLTGAGECEDAVRNPARPHHYQFKEAGARSVMRSEERQKAGGIKGAKQSEVDHDLLRRRSPEDVRECPFDLADGGAVEFADQAQARSRRRFVDGQLKVAWRAHGRLLSRAFRQEQPKGRRGQTDPQAGTPHATPLGMCRRPELLEEAARSEEARAGQTPQQSYRTFASGRRSLNPAGARNWLFARDFTQSPTVAERPGQDSNLRPAA
jgi:hypothetical protein